MKNAPSFGHCEPDFPFRFDCIDRSDECQEFIKTVGFTKRTLRRNLHDLIQFNETHLFCGDSAIEKYCNIETQEFSFDHRFLWCNCDKIPVALICGDYTFR